MSEIEKIFSENGCIEKSLPSYEKRDVQIEMAKSVEKCLETGETLLVEAGTGVGKSLAYLLPLVMWAVRNNKRAVVSTYTKALQNQLFIKDIPFVRKTTNLDFKFALCLGSENYLCLRKADKFDGENSSEKSKKEISKILKWSRTTYTGVKTDIDFSMGKSSWEHFSRETDNCLGWKCPNKDNCFYLAAKKKQSESQILITNHALLFTEILSDRDVMPDFDAIVLDEAHTLEDAATNHFREVLSTNKFSSFIESLCLTFSSEEALFVRVLGDVSEITEILEEIRKNYEKFLDIYTDQDIDGKNAQDFIKEDVQIYAENIFNGLVDFLDILDEIAEYFKNTELDEELSKISTDTQKYSELFKLMFFERKEDFVYWLDVFGKENRTLLFNASPISISDCLREQFFSKMSRVIITSATLSVSSRGIGNFTFIKNRLGLSKCNELILESPFDYKKNTLLYTPKKITDPNVDYVAYNQDVADNIVEIYKILGGRIFALFTSYDSMNRVASKIQNGQNEINILKQGDLPRYVLLDVFKKNRDSVLFGTLTFWQGVDVPGDALECVIITRLPFSVPTDPVNFSRMKKIEEEGRNPFYEYLVPRALITFKQGFGRLIRSATDRGIVAILDPRLTKKNYGKEFLKALPECSKTSKISDIQEFLSKTLK